MSLAQPRAQPRKALSIHIGPTGSTRVTPLRDVWSLMLLTRLFAAAAC